MKYCDKCGAQIVEGSVACPSCGAPVMAAAPMVATPVDLSTPVAEPPIAQAVPVMPEVAPAAPVQPAPAPAVVAPTPVAPVYTPPVAPVAPVAPKKKGGVPVILVILLLLVMAGVGLVAGKFIFGGATTNCPGTINNSTSNSITEPETETETTEPVQVATNKEVYISGHKITVPSTYDSEVDDEDILYVYDNTYTWRAEMTLTQFLYDTVSTNIESIINGFKTSGYTVEGYQEKVIEGLTLMEIKIVDPSGIKVLAAYAKVSDTYVGVITVYNQEGAEYETEKFTESVKILKTATKTTTARDFGTTNKTNQLISLLPTA